MNHKTSSPSHPPKYVLYIDKDGKDFVPTFSKCYQAAKLIDELLGDDEEYEWIGTDHDMILTTSGVTIRCSRLEKIMEYEYSKEEDRWEPEKIYLQNIQYLLYGEASEEKNNQINGSKKKKKTAKLGKHEEHQYKGVPELAREIQNTPQKTRQLLRKLMAKPDIGWKFKDEDFEKTVDKLKELSK